MAEDFIYRDIAERTNGDIYIGVVGPVRTGKSTFIKRFLETSVIPMIGNEYERNRARDELPQSAGGKTVMTTEPKFIPDEAVEIMLDGGATMRVKMVDCVGYMIPDAIGNTENGETRMVHTPWSDEPMPFEEAAEMGTDKVIREHSTIGVLVTSDGSFGDIPRSSFETAEARIAGELSAFGKPYAIILNSSVPESSEAEALAMHLEEKYKAPVALVNCLDLDEHDVAGIMEMILLEFPVREICFSLPGWMSALEDDFWLKRCVTKDVLAASDTVKKMGDIVSSFLPAFKAGVSESIRVNTGLENVCDVTVNEMDMGCGRAVVTLKLPDEIYFRIISELTGMNISDDKMLFSTLRVLAETKEEYDKFSGAIDEVLDKGYGIVMPSVEEMKLEEPEIVRQPGGYGIRLRASAESIHMIRAGIETEISPIVGTEQQSEELVRSMLRDFEEDPKKIWDSNLFGKSLYDLVNEGLHTKLEHMPDDAREKLGETLSRIINEGSSGLICIIL